jgi:hypothetical protein
MPKQPALCNLQAWTKSKRIQRRLLAHSLLAAVFAAAALIAPTLGMAQGASPFTRFIGIWRGSGQVLFTNGDAERLNCRASYQASQSNDVSLTLVCATESYRVEIHSQLLARGRDVEGTWTETTHQVTGNIAGQIAGGSFEGNITGPGLTAEMSVRSNGRRQRVTIRPQGGQMQVTDVEIDLSREAQR